MELACVFSNKVSNLPPPHLHPSKIEFEHELSMLAPANGPFLIITLFFGKQNVEWKGTGSIVIARVLACTTEREVLLLGHQTTENTRLRVS